MVARLFGVPADVLPPDYTAFRRWFDETLESDVLEVTPTALEISRAVFEPTAGAPEGRLARSITAGLLPDRLREAFGLPWDAAREARLESLAKTTTISAARPFSFSWMRTRCIWPTATTMRA